MTASLLYVLSFHPTKEAGNPPTFRFFRSTEALEMSQHVVDQTIRELHVMVGEVVPPDGGIESEADRISSQLTEIEKKVQSAFETVLEYLSASFTDVGTRVGRPPATGPVDDIRRRRFELRQRVVERRTGQAAAGPPPTPEGWLVCASCQYPYDPAQDTLAQCVGCLENKCTARCIRNELNPCTDCTDFRSIAANPDDDDESSASAVAASAPAPPPMPVQPDKDMQALERLADQESGGTIGLSVPQSALLARIPSTQFNQAIFSGKPPEPPKGDV